MSGSPATQKQIDYLLSLQGKLGLSTKFVDQKHWYGKHKIGGPNLTKAECSDLIDKALDELKDRGRG